MSRAGGIARGYHTEISGLAGPVVGFLAALAALAILYVVSRHPATPYSRALLWLSPLIVSPYQGPYELLLAALPVACLVPVLSRDRPLQVAVVLVWLTPLLSLFNTGWAPAVVSIVILFAVCAVRALSGIFASAVPTMAHRDIAG